MSSRKSSHLERISQTLQRSDRAGVTADFTTTDATDTLQNVSLERIAVRANQPRRQFDALAMRNLVESIKAHGVMQPVTLHQRPDGQLELIAGERRLRAAKEAGLATIPAKVLVGLSEKEIQLIAAMENLQREDLNPVDEVDAVLDVLSLELDIPKEQLPARLIRLRKIGLTGKSSRREPEKADLDEIDRIAQIFSQISKGNWGSFVSNRLGVLKLPEDLLGAVRSGQLEYTKAIALRKLKDPQARAQLLAQAAELSKEELRKKVRELTSPEDPSAELASRIGRLASVERLRALDVKKRGRAASLIAKLEALLK